MSGHLFFVVPDYSVPSWGVGMIFNLADMALELGVNAHVMAPRYFDPHWLKIPLEIEKIDEILPVLGQEDIVVIPEVMASYEEFRKIPARKIVFIQNGFLINSSMRTCRSFQELGYESAIVIMNHLQEIVQQFWPIETFIIPPFVADYFYNAFIPLGQRDKKILLFPKSSYLKAGYYDYEIARDILHREIQYGFEGTWEVIELVNMSHQEVASAMANASFFVCTNCFESMNATIVEAMAAGCINFCYEAYGGRDILKNEFNAFVFDNNYIFPMLKTLLYFMDAKIEETTKLQQMQLNARDTAERFRRSKTRDSLVSFLKNLGFPI